MCPPVRRIKPASDPLHMKISLYAVFWWHLKIWGNGSTHTQVDIAKQVKTKPNKTKLGPEESFCTTRPISKET